MGRSSQHTSKENKKAKKHKRRSSHSSPSRRAVSSSVEEDEGPVPATSSAHESPAPRSRQTPKKDVGKEKSTPRGKAAAAKKNIFAPKSGARSRSSSSSAKAPRKRAQATVETDSDMDRSGDSDSAMETVSPKKTVGSPKKPTRGSQTARKEKGAAAANGSRSTPRVSPGKAEDHPSSHVMPVPGKQGQSVTTTKTSRTAKKATAADASQRPIATGGSAGTTTQTLRDLQKLVRDQVNLLHDLRYSPWATNASHSKRAGIIGKSNQDRRLWVGEADALAQLTQEMEKLASARHKRVAILGNNGDGKSTLLNLLLIPSIVSDQEYESPFFRPQGYVVEARLRALKARDAASSNDESGDPKKKAARRGGAEHCLSNGCKSNRKLRLKDPLVLCKTCLRWFHVACIDDPNAVEGTKIECGDCASGSKHVRDSEFVRVSCSECEKETGEHDRGFQPLLLPAEHSQSHLLNMSSLEYDRVFKPIRGLCDGKDLQMAGDFLLPTGRPGSVTTTCNVSVVYGKTFALYVAYKTAEEMRGEALEFVRLYGQTNDRGGKRKRPSSSSSSSSSSSDSSDDSGSSDSGFEDSMDLQSIRTHAKRFQALASNPVFDLDEFDSSTDLLDVTDRVALGAIKSPGDVHISKVAKKFSELGSQVFAGEGKSLTADRVFVRDVLRQLMPSALENQDEFLCTRSHCVREVTVFIPSELLEGGLELFDVPGVNDSDVLNKGLTHDGLAKAQHIIALDKRNLKANEVLQNALREHVLQRLVDKEKGFGLSVLLVPEVQNRRFPTDFVEKKSPLLEELEHARDESHQALVDLASGFIKGRESGSKGNPTTKARLIMRKGGAVRVMTVFPKLFISAVMNTDWQADHGKEYRLLVELTQGGSLLNVLRDLSNEAGSDNLRRSVSQVVIQTHKLSTRLESLFQTKMDLQDEDTASYRDLFSTKMMPTDQRKLFEEEFQGKPFRQARDNAREQLLDVVDSFFQGATSDGADSEEESREAYLERVSVRTLRDRSRRFRKANKHRPPPEKPIPRIKIDRHVSTTQFRNAMSVDGGDSGALDFRSICFSGIHASTKNAELLERMEGVMNEICVQATVDAFLEPVLKYCLAGRLANASQNDAEYVKAKEIVEDYLAEFAADYVIHEVSALFFGLQKLGNSSGGFSVRVLTRLCTLAEQKALRQVILTKDASGLSRADMLKKVKSALRRPKADSVKRRKVQNDLSSSDEPMTEVEQKRHKSSKKKKSAMRPASADAGAEVPIASLPRSGLPVITAKALKFFHEAVGTRVKERFTAALQEVLTRESSGMVERLLDQEKMAEFSDEVRGSTWYRNLVKTCESLAKNSRHFENSAASLKILVGESAPVEFSVRVHDATSVDTSVGELVGDVDGLRIALRDGVQLADSLKFTVQPRRWITDYERASRVYQDWQKTVEQVEGSEASGLSSDDVETLLAEHELSVRKLETTSTLAGVLSSALFDEKVVKRKGLPDPTEALHRLVSVNLGQDEHLPDNGDCRALLAIAGHFDVCFRVWCPHRAKHGLQLDAYLIGGSPSGNTVRAATVKAFDLVLARADKARLIANRNLHYLPVQTALEDPAPTRSEKQKSKKRRDPEAGKSKGAERKRDKKRSRK